MNMIFETEIKKLNSKKSPGYDGASSQIIKKIANEISEPLAHIFNLIHFIPKKGFSESIYYNSYKSVIESKIVMLELRY